MKQFGFLTLHVPKFKEIPSKYYPHHANYLLYGEHFAQKEEGEDCDDCWIKSEKGRSF